MNELKIARTNRLSGRYYPRTQNIVLGFCLTGTPDPNDPKCIACVEADIEAVLTHEELHRVIHKLVNPRVAHALDDVVHADAKTKKEYQGLLY
jgi:hypothetical protein